MRIAVVGTGYVGLVTGACFAEMGNTVTCVDVDEQKVQRLKQGEIPIYEPGLDAVVETAIREDRLHFTTDIAEALKSSDYVFNAVGTPMGEGGAVDLRFVLEVARQIGENMCHYTVIINKSTVPVGTADKVQAVVSAELEKRGADIDFDVVSNPEFLKEGSAVADFMSPDRIVIGTASERAKKMMTALYSAYFRKNERLMFMGVRDAEMTKYAANAMLAAKISFMNEVANLCDAVGVDVDNVRQGIGSDSRIGYSFIYPGCGYGGSCFPKDVSALIETSRESGIEPDLLAAIDVRNNKQKQVLFSKVDKYFGGELKGKKVAVWGLAFKPGTDDMRCAPSIDLINALLAAGASVEAYDPEALETSAREFDPAVLASGQLKLIDDQYSIVEGADALVLVTEWKRFRSPDFVRIREGMKGRVIFDGRNQYDPEYLRLYNFDYVGIGRSNLGS